MSITPDTNLLVRALTRDDPAQAVMAEAELSAADGVVLATPMLCELVWVLRRGYGRAPAEIAGTIRRLTRSAGVACDRSAVEVGLDLLEAGGDFADGAIAADGARLGGGDFVSFDRDAVGILTARGIAARPPRGTTAP